jgi:hypothetical protein
MENHVTMCLGAGSNKDLDSEEESECEEQSDCDEESDSEEESGSEGEPDSDVDSTDEQDNKNVCQDATIPLELSDNIFKLFGKGKWLQGAIVNQDGFWIVAAPETIQQRRNEIVNSIVANIDKSSAQDLCGSETFAFVNSQWFKKKGFNQFKYLPAPNPLLHISYERAKAIGSGKSVRFGMLMFRRVHQPISGYRRA